MNKYENKNSITTIHKNVEIIVVKKTMFHVSN